MINKYSMDISLLTDIGFACKGITVGGCLLVNSIKAEVAARLTRAGHPPKVLTAGAVIGSEKATALFESAYDEHARRLAKLYQHLGETKGG